MSVLRDVVAAADPALREHAVAEPPDGRFDSAGGHGRFQRRLEGTRAFVLEAVYEGYLLHYGEPRAFAGMDDDLRLLAGDALYALGLERLAEAGDLEAVAELSDLISASAQAHAEGRGAGADALWEATSTSLSTASS